MNNPLVVKLGGSLLNNEIIMNHIFNNILWFRLNKNISIIIVHGGGVIVDELMEKLSITTRKKNGLRITPSNQIDIITGALAGIANKKLLAYAKKFKVNAVGLSLGDADLMTILKINNNFGNVGKAIPKNPLLISSLLDIKYMPIISSIGITDDGELMNINADHAAIALAYCINANLIFVSDVNGIMDINGKIIDKINTIKANKLISDGIIKNGMIIKLKSALEATHILNRPVYIGGWQQIKELFYLIFTNILVGTKIYL
ncbi:MAG: acetylglutamate kinase [Pantoea sp. Brub]|nr:acetylglutamate kinase [Pantoea sp. Brub]